jgi:hypothetical protein
MSGGVKLGQAFGDKGGGFGSEVSSYQEKNPTKLARYTVLKPLTVTKDANTKSSKIGQLQPGEFVEVIKIGNTVQSGRTRLQIAEPRGWIFDKTKSGDAALEEVAINRGWSSGSIDMSAFDVGGASRASFKASSQKVDRMESVDDAKAWLAAASWHDEQSAIPAYSPPDALVTPQTTFGTAPTGQTGTFPVFGQQPAATFGTAPPGQTGAFPVFGQPPVATVGQTTATPQATEEGVPGKNEALSAMLPVLASMPAAAFSYMSGWVNDQGATFVASVAAARVGGGGGGAFLTSAGASF